VYASCKCSSSCCAVFRFDVYVDISVGSVMATCLCPLLCCCCTNDDLTSVVLCLIYVRVMQVLVGTLVFVW
jgi:hypothetical protein